MLKHYRVPDSVWRFIKDADMDIKPAPDGPAWRCVKIEWGRRDRISVSHVVGPEPRPDAFYAFSSGEDRLDPQEFAWVPARFRSGRLVKADDGQFTMSRDWGTLAGGEPYTAVFIADPDAQSDVVFNPNMRYGRDWHTCPEITWQWVDPAVVPVEKRVAGLEQRVLVLEGQLATLYNK